LIFAFDTLPQAIKLMALKGLFWTKAWGGLYLASFVAMECLIIASKRGPYKVLDAEDGDDGDEQSPRGPQTK
jgi:hypothetical protein